jgi:hypothetical protein
LPLPPGFAFLIKYVSPTYLLVIFVLFVSENTASYATQVLRQREATLAVAFIALLAVAITYLTHRAGRRWAQSGLPL